MSPQGEHEDVRTVVVEFQAFRGVQNEYVVKNFAAVDPVSYTHLDVYKRQE